MISWQFPNLKLTAQRVDMFFFWGGFQQVISFWYSLVRFCRYSLVNQSSPILRHWELALALLSEMVHRKLRWDNISLTCAVRACGSCSEWQVAMQLLLWMKFESLKTWPFTDINQWRLVWSEIVVVDHENTTQCGLLRDLAAWLVLTSMIVLFLCVLLLLKTPEWLIQKNKRYFIKTQIRIRYYFLPPVFANSIRRSFGAKIPDWNSYHCDATHDDEEQESRIKFSSPQIRQRVYTNWWWCHVTSFSK